MPGTAAGCSPPRPAPAAGAGVPRRADRKRTSANPSVGALAPPGNAKDDDAVHRLVDPIHDPEVTDPQAPEQAPLEGSRARWPRIARHGRNRAAQAGGRVGTPLGKV